MSGDQVLEGRVAVITGAASGLGEATARRFVAAGARVMLADIQDEPGEKLAAELGSDARYRHCDVSEESDVAALVDAAQAEWGQVDCMFANAGVVGVVGPIDETPIEAYDATMAILMRGVFLCMKHAARVMKPRGQGTILSTSSIAGLQGGLGPHVYAAAKAGLIGLTRNVAAELGPQGIRVNCIAPGNMATPMVADVIFGAPDRVSRAEQALAGASPLKDRAGLAVDIAEDALWLASDATGYVNGHTLVVDAGLTTGATDAVPPIFQRSQYIGEAGRREPS